MEPKSRTGSKIGSENQPWYSKFANFISALILSGIFGGFFLEAHSSLYFETKATFQNKTSIPVAISSVGVVSAWLLFAQTANSDSQREVATGKCRLPPSVERTLCS